MKIKTIEEFNKVIENKYTGFIESNGDTFWYKEGKPHREDGPAIEHSNGTKYWYKEGKHHRDDGPALEDYSNSGIEWWSKGNRVPWTSHKEWWIEGNLHREDGPAIEQSNGTKCWYIGGKRHRLDGPAIEFIGGNKKFFIEGKEYTEYDFIKESSALLNEKIWTKDQFDKLSKKKQTGCFNFNGDKCWYKEGELHREDGPAIEYFNGSKCWYKDGKYHRLDGPAIEHVNGDKCWYKDGKEYHGPYTYKEWYTIANNLEKFI